MFRQPFRAKSEAVLKGTERKKLRADVQRQWQLFTADMLKEFIPSRVEITVYRISVGTSEYVNVYFHQSQPIVFEYNEVLYPTVYTAWKFPAHMVTVTTWSSYAAKLLAGDDLPLQAVHFSSEDESRTSQYIQPGRSCCIATTETRSAIAVGRACLSGTRMLLNVAKGTAFVTMHCYGDQLWAVGCKGRPPWVIERPPTATNYDNKKGSVIESRRRSTKDSDLMSIKDGSSSGRKGLQESVYYAEENGNITELAGKLQTADAEFNSAENKLYICTINAIKSRMKEVKMPMDALQFYLECTKCCKERHPIDMEPLRHSEKIVSFLKKLEHRRLITLQATTKRTYNILSVNYEHKDVQSYDSHQHLESQLSKTETVSPYEPPEITELLSVNSTTSPLLSKLGFRKGDTLTKASLRGVVTKYVTAQGLQCDNKTHVKMDKLLSQTLCGEKIEIINSHMNLAEITERLSKKMDNIYQLIFPNGPVVLRKSSPSIQISLNSNTNGHKATTLIRHLDRYRMDLNSFAEEIRVAKQCSTTVTARQGSSLVIAIGNHIAFVYKTLKDKYRIPATYIDLV